MKFNVDSFILRSSTRVMLPLLLLFSVFLLFGGHNEPGGGFVGGLVAAAGFGLYAMAYDTNEVRRAIRVGLQPVVGFGLLLGAGSGIFGIAAGLPYLTGLWTDPVRIPGLEGVKIGTPTVFDVGVYLVVASVTLMMILALGDED